MAKILDVNKAITKLDEDVATLQGILDFFSLVESGMDTVVNMDGSMTGEGGEAIILNHAELQLPTVRAFRAHISNTIEKIEKMKGYILDFEPSEDGVVTEDYWDTQMKRGLYKVEESTDQSKENVDAITSSVSHIINLGKLNVDNVLNRVDSSRKVAGEVVDELYTLDADGVDLMKEVQSEGEELKATVKKAVEWTTAGGLTMSGVNIQDVRSYFSDATLHMQAPEVDVERLTRDGGDEPTLMQDVINFIGTDAKNIQNWGIVGVDAARGAAATIMFTTGMLILEDVGQGSYKLSANSAWTQQKGIYQSKFAAKTYDVMKHPAGQRIGGLYGNSPAGVIKDAVSLKGMTTTGTKGLLERSAGPMLIYRNGQPLVNNFQRGAGFRANTKNLLVKNVYQNFKPTIKSIDVKNSLKNIKPGGGGWQKNLARGGNVLAIGLNFMEAFSDDHKDKSIAQKTGRALTGAALDIGAGYAGATAGAAIGTMIFPGVGTVVGGFVGAAIGGIAANTFLGEPVRQVGEKIGAAAEKVGKAVVDTVKDAGEAVGNFLSGGAKALGSLFG